MARFKRGAVSPRRRRGMALPLRGAPFPLCRSILMQGLHFKRRKASLLRWLIRYYAKILFRLFTCTRLRGPPAELAPWLEVCLASQVWNVPHALRGLFIFYTETEKREDLSTFVKDTWRLGTSTDPGRDPTAAVVEWFSDLHSLGFSLSGYFNATDFAVDHSGLLRGERKLLQNLRKFTLKRRIRDMESCADMIEFCFYNRALDHSGPIPVETKHLVWLLKHFKPRYSFLVCYHACHEDEDHKIDLLETMCTRLLVLEKIDEPKYNRIMEKLQCCFLPWMPRHMQKGYLIEVLEYHQGQDSEFENPELLVGLQKAMDEEGELVGLGCHRHRLNSCVQLLHEC